MGQEQKKPAKAKQEEVEEEVTESKDLTNEELSDDVDDMLADIDDALGEIEHAESFVAAFKQQGGQ